MFKIILLLTLITIGFASHWKPNKRHVSWRNRHGFHHSRCHNRHHETLDIEDIRNQFIQTDKQLEDLCRKNIVNAKETYGEDFYTLKYELAETENLNITVRVSDQLIHTKVERINDKTIILEDLKVLPNIVKPGDATWDLESNSLKILMRYKVPIGTETSTNCGILNTGVIFVPPIKFGTIDLADIWLNSGELDYD